jgi:galactose mutarotase-like enzyme
VTPGIRIDTRQGTPAMALGAGDLQATVLPTVGMTGASLQVDGHELVVLRGGPRRVAAGHTAGIPLLYPWANRLGRRRFEVAGKAVDLRRVDVHADPAGLPMHGTLLGSDAWDIAEARATGRSASLVARLAYDTPALLDAFPFPHTVEVAFRVERGALTVTTTVRADRGGPVPVSFGWHPYLHVPGRVASWRLRRPARQRLHLDRRLIPTGAVTAEPAEDAPIGSRTFDDGYALGDDRRFALAGDGVRIDLAFDHSYGFAQIYHPARSRFACIEPMVAATNALVTGSAPIVPAGGTFEAAFEIRPSLTV